jgi:tripartite-type tricarboxylate transporter receptor subunit TctC
MAGDGAISVWAAAFYALTLSASLNAAAAFPERPVRLIVAQSPGGNADIIGRALAEGLSERFGQTVIVDNRGGASGIIAIELTVRAPADGHTLILVVGPALTVKSVAELIQVAKSRPGELTFGSSGNLGSPHLAGELFNLMAGVKMVHVPYKGAAASLTDLIAGRISMSFASLPSAIGHVRSGRLRALAVTSEKRFSLVPELPAIAELGFPGFETSAWQGLLAPANTPRAIVNRINADAAASVTSPTMRNLLAANGAEGVGNSPAAFADYVQKQIVKWTKVVQAAGIQAE